MNWQTSSYEPANPESRTKRNPSRFDTSTDDRTSRRGKGGVIALFAGLALLTAAGVFAVMNKGDVTEMKESLAGAVDKVAPVEPRIVIPSGTPVVVTLQSTISTKTANEGDRFTATTAAPVMVDGMEAIPGGATVSGRVISVKQPGKASGRGELQFAFDTASWGGHTYDLGSRSAVFQSKSGTDKDVAMIGGGTIGGGILGGILGDGKGDAAKGAVIGGAAGTAATLLTRGPQLTFEPGQKIRFTLDQNVSVRRGDVS